MCNKTYFAKQKYTHITYNRSQIIDRKKDIFNCRILEILGMLLLVNFGFRPAPKHFSEHPNRDQSLLFCTFRRILFIFFKTFPSRWGWLKNTILLKTQLSTLTWTLYLYLGLVNIEYYIFILSSSAQFIDSIALAWLYCYIIKQPNNL